MRHLISVVAVVLALGTLTACDTSSTRCTNRVCTINVSGTPTVELEDFAGRNRDVRLSIEAIQGGRVTVSTIGGERTLGPGESATLGRVAVRVLRVAGTEATLEASPA